MQQGNKHILSYYEDNRKLLMANTTINYVYWLIDKVTCMLHIAQVVVVNNDFRQLQSITYISVIIWSESN